MPLHSVTFQFLTGINGPLFSQARLTGSWDLQGRWSNHWTVQPMNSITGSDGCPAFEATWQLSTDDAQRTFQWGVILDGPQGSNFWGIPTEVQDVHSTARTRHFRIDSVASPQIERFYLTYLRRLGANKLYLPGHSAPRLQFGVWAPHAQQVEVVFGRSDNGYISDAGDGIDATKPVVQLEPHTDGIWLGMAPGDFAEYMGQPYMYRLKNAQGHWVYRTDIFSRSQIGKGHDNPRGGPWTGTAETLDGTVSCSVVIDPDMIRPTFQSAPAGSMPQLVTAQEFWASEFSFGKPVPTRVEDLVIYELHVGSLGFGHSRPGSLEDAMAFLDHLVSLGINAVELMPLAEFSGSVGWGYGDTHHLCIEASAGGRDKYRHFVRECHRRGIAVIQDVVYNHYDNNADRAQWQYDSTTPEQNIYYWYEGRSQDYQDANGGYLDNGSTGWTPRFWEETLRQQFISSAVFLIEEMHVDGLRVDLTQAIHRDNVLHADGRSIGSANIFGQKLLREWSRTLHMIHPTSMLIAEDHTHWDAVTKPPAQMGLGFDATWQASFYHSLIGDAHGASGAARLLREAGTGHTGPLAMDRFAGELYASQFKRVVFHESHDEAGNAGGTARTLPLAVNYAPLIDETRRWAEARARVCTGLSLLSAGTPMFFMGEEVGAQNFFRVFGFLADREDILGLRQGSGQSLFRFYQDLITLCKRLPSIRSQNIDILHLSNENRTLAFKRWISDEQVIVVASLNNAVFDHYRIHKDSLGIPRSGWKEIFNSDAAIYGGRNVGNRGAIIDSLPGSLELILPAAGFVVLIKQ